MIIKHPKRRPCSLCFLESLYYSSLLLCLLSSRNLGWEGWRIPWRFSCSSQVLKTLLTRAVLGHGTGQRAARAVRRTAAVESVRAVRGRVAWRGCSSTEALLITVPGDSCLALDVSDLLGLTKAIQSMGLTSLRKHFSDCPAVTCLHGTPSSQCQAVY